MPNATEAKRRLRVRLKYYTTPRPNLGPTVDVGADELRAILDDHDRLERELAAYRAFRDAIIAEWRITLVHWTQAWRVGAAIEELEAKLAPAGKGE